MHQPPQIKPWLSQEEMISWIQEAPDREAYQKRLTIWLTIIGSFHTHEIAQMLCVSKEAVWLWVSQYNKNGPDGLEHQGRGGRR
jgi:transposase